MNPGRERRWLPLLLLALTFLTTLLAGASFGGAPGPLLPAPASGEYPGILPFIAHTLAFLMNGLPYALTVLGILGAHEMGHYIACRVYGVQATWPHFLPSPFLFGTFGAFIRIHSPIPGRRALFDIAMAGPLAGYALTIPALAYGIVTAQVGELPPGSVSTRFGTSLLVSALKGIVWGEALDGRQLFVGQVFFAGWLGQLATCLNLFPVGQLDGGHLVYAASARHHQAVSRSGRWGMLGFLALLFLLPALRELLNPAPLSPAASELFLHGLASVAPWVAWTVLLFVVGDRHPLILDAEPLGSRRKLLLGLTLAIFILSFVPVPLQQVFVSP